MDNISNFPLYKNKPFLRPCSPPQNKNKEYQLKQKVMFHKFTVKEQNKPDGILFDVCICLVQILSNLDCVAKIKVAVEQIKGVLSQLVKG